MSEQASDYGVCVIGVDSPCNPPIETPEPATWVMLAVGLALGIVARRFLWR